MSKNIAASVGRRLRNLARRRNEDFGLVLTKYGLERVLFRLSRSKHRDAFVLKGAVLFELRIVIAPREKRLLPRSRMKDFHDLSVLAALFHSRRKTDVPARLPTALTAEFYEDLSKRRQWTAFIERNRLYIEPRPLADHRSFAENWPAAGPWTRSQ